MTVSGYAPSPTGGGFCGCLAAAVVGVPGFGFVLLASSLGDCFPNTPCDRGLNLWLFILATLITTAAGLAVRWLVRGYTDGRKGE